MKKIGHSLITLTMLLAFMPFNLKEGAGSGKVADTISKTIDQEYLLKEMCLIKDTCHRIHKGALFVSAGGLLVIVLLIIVLLD